MRINGMLIAGRPARVFRDVFRKISYHRFRPALLAEYMSLDKSDAESMMVVLEREGYITKDEAWWCLTPLAGRVAAANLLKPMSRKKIDALMAAVIERAAAIATDPLQTYAVKEIKVLGSYLDPDKPDYGDLDLVCVIERKPQYADHTAAYDAFFELNNVYPKGLSELYSIAQNNVLRAIKKRDGRISFVDEYTIKRYDIATKTVYHDPNL